MQRKAPKKFVSMTWRKTPYWHQYSARGDQYLRTVLIHISGD
jgi:hypothetical protein